MTTLEAAAPPAAPVPVAAAAAARFTGSRPAFTRLMIRGAVLQAVTLGIYRFWLITDVRRFLWANTEIDGDSLDYTGTATELLIGFLFALAILVPIYVLFFIAGLELGLYSQLAGAAAFAFLTLFGQYALYRARRYRLTRTVYRGIRFHQDGSAFVYAARTFAWAFPVVLTLGLAYPFAQASLERYKVGHTLYGDLRGRFAGSGSRLFGRGLFMWVLTVGPLIAAVGLSAAGIDWAAFADDIARDRFDDLDQAVAVHPGLATFTVLVPGAFSWSLLAALILYPAFQGMVLKWWLAGLRFGEVRVATSLRKRQLYGAYLRFVLLSVAITLLLAIAATIIVLAAGGSFAAMADMGRVSAQIGIGLAVVGFYLGIALTIWVVWQVAVKLAIWRMTVDSVTLENFSTIALVRSGGEAASAIGEGLADALGSGGF
ncbi:DUF898 family protein [Xanthobacteraceae bacterium Astr-EGSB]|uniref:DUF898 family protein n=1 Tax=Astrobacterium formosum TaxID=3069710 RepID=UPI0027B84BF0|nr:DUF898 family protein [Xanthobacteraceae bacterium Astr-EGSB]